MKGIFQLILGLAFLILVFLTLTHQNWYLATIKLLQGGLVLTIFFIGFVLTLLGITEIKKSF